MPELLEMPKIGGAVIPFGAMLPDEGDDVVIAKLRQLNAIMFAAPSAWNGQKERLRRQLDSICAEEGYIGFWGDSRNYALHRVGQSFQFDVPMNQRGWLAPFRGKRVRIICLRSGAYRRWLRAGHVKRIEA